MLCSMPLGEGGRRQLIDRSHNPAATCFAYAGRDEKAACHGRVRERGHKALADVGRSSSTYLRRPTPPRPCRRVLPSPRSGEKQDAFIVSGHGRGLRHPGRPGGPRSRDVPGREVGRPAVSFSKERLPRPAATKRIDQTSLTSNTASHPDHRGGERRVHVRGRTRTSGSSSPRPPSRAGNSPSPSPPGAFLPDGDGRCASGTTTYCGCTQLHRSADSLPPGRRRRPPDRIKAFTLVARSARTRIGAVGSHLAGRAVGRHRRRGADERGVSDQPVDVNARVVREFRGHRGPVVPSRSRPTTGGSIPGRTMARCGSGIGPPASSSVRSTAGSARSKLGHVNHAGNVALNVQRPRTSPTPGTGSPPAPTPWSLATLGGWYAPAGCRSGRSA